MIYLYIVLGILFSWIVFGNLYYAIKHPKIRFDIYFGVPGSGKTTFAAYLTKKAAKKKKKKNIRILSNVPIKGAYKVQKQDIGHYQIDNCNLLLDEAGIDYNNRNYNKFSDDETYFFKYHRHYNVNIAIFSQDYEDMDKKLRKLATRYFIVKKSIFPGFVYRREIQKRIGIDKMTKQIIDEYKFKFFLFGTKYIYCPKLWQMFNSYDYKELPPKEFTKW